LTVSFDNGDGSQLEIPGRRTAAAQQLVSASGGDVLPNGR
jgi:hypothetical protein